MNKKEKRPILEESLIVALRAIDNQIAREMQRTPQEKELHGVQKWEPFSKRVELITTLLLDSLGEGEVELDSLLVLSQATTKALSLAVQDLEKDGLGKIRTDYCLTALKAIESDCYRGSEVLRDSHELM